jgi:hypothetical protein
MSSALDFIRSSSPGLVYKSLLFARHIKFQYPPSGLLLLDLMRRLGLGGYSQLNIINAWGLIATGVVFSILTAQVLGPVRYRGFRIPLEPIAFVVAIKFFPDRFAYTVGQIQVLLGLLFLLACVAMFHDRRYLAGLLIAAIASIKPQFLVFGLLAVRYRDWRFLKAFALLTVVTVLASIWLYGGQAQISYYHDVLPFLSRHGECYHTNQSINGILNRYLQTVPCVDSDPHADPGSPVVNSWFPPYNAVVYVATLISSLILLAVPFLFRTNGQDRVSVLLDFCIAGLLFTMASPIAWTHHYNIMIPGYLVGLKIARERLRGRQMWMALCVLALSFVLASTELSSAFSPTDPSRNLIQSHVFFGALLLLALLIFEVAVLRRAAIPS